MGGLLWPVVLAIHIVTSSGGPPDRADSSTTALRQDISASLDTLRLRDPELTVARTRSSFDSAARELFALPATTPRHRLILKWAEVIATLHDGHTQLGLARDSAIGFHQFPIRTYWFEEGFFITSVISGYERLLGAQLLSIDGVPVAQVVARITPIIHGDNASAVRSILPSRTTLGEVLEGSGVTREINHAVFTLRLTDGKTENVSLSGFRVGTDVKWVLARERLAHAPLYLSNTSAPYWYAYIDSAKTLYVQYNSVENDANNSFDAFCARLFRAVDSLGAERLVLDIRNNNGGDNTLLRPLERGLINSRLNRPGHLYVVIGRLTFSAAVNLAADLEKWTAATFVGEPTAAPANHYGETQALKLPRTGSLLLYSSLFYQSVGNPKDTRESISPAMSIPVRAADYFAGRDPVLEAILRQPAVTSHISRNSPNSRL